MNKYLRLFRLGNTLIGSFAILIAAFMAAGTGMIDYWQNLVIGFAVVFTFIAGGNSLNDFIDVEIDKTAHPGRPVPSGELTPIQARNIGIVMLVLSAVLSLLTVDIPSIAIVIIAVILMASYELFLKQRGFIGNLTIAVMTGMVFLLAGALVGDYTSNIAVAGMATLVSVGREISKDIEDMESDIGRKTLPMSIGVRNASIVASLFYLAGPILSWYPIYLDPANYLYYSVILADIAFFYCAYKVFSDPHAAEKKAKIGMLFGLLAFILSAIYYSFLA
ncbi:MAG: geranylgeranylglycerol-phosphate geranylgeranyltransferase [Candidatus Methanomethylophilaceae archaeon]|nr:geranylgeranylglycerol-phosphate geranylgeranyltransferase [Candidatus Methanomethylophilaceae archaeon]